jgi:hypothetical protein
MRNSKSNLLLSLITVIAHTGSASADDVVVDLDTGDEFVVEDGRTSVGTIVADGEGGPNHTATAILMGNGSANIHPLCIYRSDGWDPNRRGTWLWKGDGGPAPLPVQFRAP